MTITKSATATLSRNSVGLTRHEHDGTEPSVVLSVDSDGIHITHHFTIEDWDILRETVMEFDVHEEATKTCPHGLIDVANCGHCLKDFDLLCETLEDDSVDPVGGDIETATMLKSKTHDAWMESVQDLNRGPRYVLHYRSLDGQLHSRTGDRWRWSGNRELAIKRLHELEESGEAMVKA